MTIELSRYCIPWTPFKKRLEDAIVLLASTAGVHHQNDPPFEVEGDLSFRSIPVTASMSELRVADAHYDHACIDADLNSIFPLERLYELAHGERRLGGLSDVHFSTGFTQELRRFRDQTVPALAAEIGKQRPDAVVLTGG